MSENEYTPDAWDLLKISSPEHGVFYKIIAGWYGGFAGSDSWKISSGIEKVIDHDHYWELPQSSGSVYICYKNQRRLSGLMASTLHSIQKDPGLGAVTVELLSTTDLNKLEINNVVD